MDLGFDVVELPPHDAPEEGERAPDFTRPLVNKEYWEDAALSEVAEAHGHVLVVFYPMDGSFPATYIWNEVLDRGWAKRSDRSGDEYDVEVVGVTVSTPYAHSDFIEDRGIDARLFSDPANTVAGSYGVAHELDGMTGIAEPRPAVFLVDGTLKVEYAWVADEHPEFPPYDEIEDALRRVED